MTSLVQQIRERLTLTSRLTPDLLLLQQAADRIEELEAELRRLCISLTLEGADCTKRVLDRAIAARPVLGDTPRGER